MTTPSEPPTLPAAAGPPVVSRFEYNLLRLTRFILGAMPVEQAQSLVYQRVVPAPQCLTATCVRLVQDTLAKGLVQFLVRAGGWRRDRYLRDNQPREGRAWERHPLDARKLEFGPHPLSFLMWLTAEKPNDTKEAWNPSADELTPADELFFALVLQATRPMLDVVPALARKSVFAHNPPCWLLNPADFRELGPAAAPDVAPLAKGLRAVVVECLQPWLTQRWTVNERSKGQISDWGVMRAQGQAELQFLTAYLDAVEAAKRPDLARFLLHTARTVLGGEADVALPYWVGGLQTNAPPRLQDRLETQRLALALPRQMGTLQRWDRAARTVGYFDDDYAATQVWKADWEQAQGDAVAARAKQILDKLDPLKG